VLPTSTPTTVSHPLPRPPPTAAASQSVAVDEPSAADTDADDTDTSAAAAATDGSCFTGCTRLDGGDASDERQATDGTVGVRRDTKRERQALTAQTDTDRHTETSDQCGRSQSVTVDEPSSADTDADDERLTR
jgi:hypothetical protein